MNAARNPSLFLVIERFAPCKYKGIQDSLGFWIPRHGFRIPGTGFRILCQWKLDFGFQSLVGFRIPEATISQISESGYPYKGRKDIRKEVATKSLLKPLLFLHSMLAHDNIYMDLNNAREN